MVVRRLQTKRHHGQAGGGRSLERFSARACARAASGVEPLFAVDFVGVGVEEELVEQGVGGFDGEDLVGGEQGREPLLPVVVAAFDFAPFDFAQGRLLACGVGA